jgi:DNA-binding MarR family transcriptional regulator
MNRNVRKTEVTRFLDAWFAVRQFIQASNFNRFQRAGLSATQFMTLNLLPAKGEGIAIGELARRMNLKPATVAQTVDSLESREMLERFRSPEDKRVVYVRITAAGVELQNAASAQFHSQVSRLLAELGPEELAGLNAGLEALVRAIALDPEHSGGNSTSAPHAARRRGHSKRQSLRP